MTQSTPETNAARDAGQIVAEKLSLIGSTMLPGEPVECYARAADAVVGLWFRFTDKKTGMKRYAIVTECDAPRYVSAREFDDNDTTAMGVQPQRYLRREITQPLTPNV